MGSKLDQDPSSLFFIRALVFAKFCKETDKQTLMNLTPKVEKQVFKNKGTITMLNYR